MQPSAKVRHRTGRSPLLEQGLTQSQAEELLKPDFCGRIGFASFSLQNSRVMLIFPDKPEADVRSLLKRHGFKWSPSRNAWVRMLNNAGRYAAERVREQLDR